ncbi:MAG: NADH-quinone oxidoreductase subunit K [Candidatus Aminicenantes bacterium]|nr:NADH-quinone oxidoreductase subunit K [Candidatus Aminicenantes bacterium]
MTDAWIVSIAFAAALVVVGLYGLLTMRNLIKLFIGIEVVAKGVSLILLSAGWARGNVLVAQSLVVTFIVIEVALVATALALIINITRKTKSLDVRKLARLKG